MRSAGVLALGLAVAVARLAGQQLVATERAEVVATLWAEARYNFAFWDRVRADWDSALSANLRLAAQPQSDVLFYRRLRRLVALLGDGQAAVVPPANLRSRIARPPLLLESVEQRPLIRDYAENDEMRVARPERLAEILAVQGIPAESWVRDSVLPETSAATPLDRWQRKPLRLRDSGAPHRARVPGSALENAAIPPRVPRVASARLRLLLVRPAPRYRFPFGGPPRLHRTDRRAGVERDGRGGRGLSGGVPERHAWRDHRGDVGRQSGRGAHDRAPQELGDAALRDAPRVSQRGRVRGKGDPAGVDGLVDRRRRAGGNGRGPRAGAGVRGREAAVSQQAVGV